MTHDPATIARAFEIADEAMFVGLESYGVPNDEHHTVFGLAGESGGEVNTLAEAGRDLREAVEWLTLRGYVELANDTEGEHVLVLRRPGDE